MTGSKKEDSTRDCLLNAGLKLFVASDYDKISTRQIASEAGCNIGMIRYYFNNKLGLFEAVLSRFQLQMKANVADMKLNINKASLADVLRFHYELMTPYPDFPKLIFRVMSFGNKELQQQVVDSLLTTMPSDLDDIIVTLQQRRELQANLDPTMVRISLLSLMIFPFLMPAAMLELHGIKLSSEFFSQLSQHNQELLSHGFSTAS